MKRTFLNTNVERTYLAARVAGGTITYSVNLTTRVRVPADRGDDEDFIIRAAAECLLTDPKSRPPTTTIDQLDAVASSANAPPHLIPHLTNLGSLIEKAGELDPVCRETLLTRMHEQVTAALDAHKAAFASGESR